MRVGIFTNTYKPTMNENSIVVENLVKGLEHLGHKVFVITLSNPNAGKESNVIRLSKSVDNGAYGVAGKQGITVEEKNKIKELKLDMVHAFGVNSVAALGKRVAADLNIPYVVSLLRDEEYAFSKERTVLGKKPSKLKNKIFSNRYI